MWPVKGKVLATFTEANKGIDIGGRKGAPVVAAADGAERPLERGPCEDWLVSMPIVRVEV